MMTSSRRAYAIPRSAASEPLSLRQKIADPYLHKLSNFSELIQSRYLNNQIWVEKRIYKNKSQMKTA